MIEPALDDWPRCSRCGAPRLSECPACGTAGSAFERADQQGAGEPLRATRPDASPPNDASPSRPTMVVCPQCDDVFVPRYYRQCAHCGQEEAAGLTVPTAGPGTDANRRLIWSVLGLVLLGLLGALYLAWLFR